MYRTTKGKFAARAGVALALSLGALAASVSVASAETNDSGRVWGTVSAASATSITVTNRVGVSSTFAITSTTTVLEGWTTATTAALMTGEHVTVLPTTPTSGVAARMPRSPLPAADPTATALAVPAPKHRWPAD